MLRARGEYLLMVDADGATQITDVERLEAALKKAQDIDPHVIVAGSRAHLQDDAVATVMQPPSLFALFSFLTCHWLALVIHITIFCFNKFESVGIHDYSLHYGS